MVPRSKMFSGRTFPLSQAQSTSSGLHFDPRINCIQYWTAASARRLSWLQGQQTWAAKEIRLKCLHERERLFWALHEDGWVDVRDERILRELTPNARITNGELAKRVPVRLVHTSRVVVAGP